MRIEEAIIARLEALTGIGSLVEQVGERIFANDIDQGESLPAICVTVPDEGLVSGEDGVDLSGQGTLFEADVEVICFARTLSEARNIAELVRDNNTNPGTGLNGFEGDAGAGEFFAVHTRSETGEEPPPSGEGSGRYYVAAGYYAQFHRNSHGN